MSATPIPPPRLDTQAEWRRYPERGNQALLRLMARVSLRLGRRSGRVPLLGIAIYFFLFAPTARRRMREYLRRALGREPRARDRFRLVMNFATTIHDRLYLLTGRFDLFDVTIVGEPLIREVVESGQGAFLMGAHVGSFEVLRSIGEQQPGLNVVMAMYGDNAQKINAILGASAPARGPEIICLGQLQAMLQIQERLEQGACVGLLADRTLGDEPTLAVSFLGATAHLPLGPMRAAAALRRRVIFMLGPYRGANRYSVIFEPLADFSHTPRAALKSATEAAVRRFGALLEQHCRADPYNWFNFFDFWQVRSGASDAAPARAEQPP